MTAAKWIFHQVFAENIPSNARIHLLVDERAAARGYTVTNTTPG